MALPGSTCVANRVPWVDKVTRIFKGVDWMSLETLATRTCMHVACMRARPHTLTDASMLEIMKKHTHIRVHMYIILL